MSLPANGTDIFYGTIDGDQTVENAVLAGPVTFPGTVTVTGTLVIV